MGLTPIGLQALFDDKDFQAGLLRYKNGVDTANTVTDKGAGLMTKLGAVASGALAVGLAAATAAVAGFVAISKIGLDATLQWSEDLDRLGDQFGLSGEDASKWAVAMQHVGLTVDEGAQGLNFFTRGLAETSKVAKDGSVTLTPFGEALKKLGVNAYGADGKLKDFNKIMPEMMDAFKRLPAGVDASALAMDLFGARGGTKFLDFLRQGSVGLAEADKFAKDFGLTMSTDAVNAAEEFGFTMNDLQLAMKGIWNQIGAALLPVLKDLVELVNKEVLPVFAKWVKENAPKLTVALRTLGTWFMKEGIPAIRAFAGWVTGTLLPALKQAWDFIQKNVVPIVQRLIKLFTEDMPKAQKSTEGALQNIWQAFQQVWKVVGPILDKIFKELSRFWTEIQPKLEKAWDNISKNVKEAWDAIWKIIKPAVETIQKFIEDHMDDIQKAWEGVWNEIGGFVKVAWELIKGIVKVALDVLGGDMDAAGRDWEEMQRGIWAGIQQIISGAWDIIKGIFGLAIAALAGIIQSKYNEIVTAIRNLMDGIVAGINNALTNITTAMFLVIQSAINVIGTFVGNAISAGISLIQGIAGGILSGIGALIEAFRTAVQNAMTWLAIQVSFIGNLFGQLASIGWNIIQGIIDGVTSNAQNLFIAIYNAVANAVRGLLNLLGIHSPSRLMSAIGANMAQSLAAGFGVPQLDLAINPALAGGPGISLPRGGGGGGSFSSSSSIVNNFNLNIHSAAPVSTVAADFGILRSLA